MKRIVTMRALHRPLMDAGLVPPDCRLMDVRIGIDGPLIITYEVHVSAERLSTLGEVFTLVAKTFLQHASDSEPEE